MTVPPQAGNGPGCGTRHATVEILYGRVALISANAVFGGFRPAHFYETPTRRTTGARDL